MNCWPKCVQWKFQNVFLWVELGLIFCIFFSVVENYITKNKIRVLSDNRKVGSVEENIFSVFRVLRVFASRFSGAC